ncbi:helix-turn-helix domain-containing protein [Terriglobus roseus]|uniref:Helix-turn-helix domain-containing protein n=1 Tax=Terriglobus roseus TaxID=392734 RepID=A0A1H4SH75_9BACT|nr:helix-turn-helix transcriptional regulator [Terriglobus roseus]SEC43448.1 Helix-turn-helix domain-containing protein [Terriglobus roseus]
MSTTYIQPNVQSLYANPAAFPRKIVAIPPAVPDRIMHYPVSVRFGKRLRELRTERNLSQARMAKVFGIDRTFISDVERGRKAMSLTTLEIVALGLQISLSDLLRDI